MGFRWSLGGVWGVVGWCLGGTYVGFWECLGGV